MTNPWDEFAYHRHNQILSGQDISYDYVLLPTIVSLMDNKECNNRFSVLDIGCSTGILIKRIKKECLRITGIDSSRESIRIAREYLCDTKDVKVFNSSIIDFLPTKTDEYDMLVANMVLHTIEDISSAVKSAYRLLKKNGVFIISIPHPCFWAEYQKIQMHNPYIYIESKEYLLDFKISNNQKSFPEKIPYFHRPLAFYINLLIETGFTLEKIDEPYPSNNIMTKYETPWDNPHFLFIRVKK